MSNEFQNRTLSELDRIVLDFLAGYWTAQGIPKDQAESAARKAIVQIYLNAHKEKWCLLPEIW
jgi:hypothetical protein